MSLKSKLVSAIKPPEILLLGVYPTEIIPNTWEKGHILHPHTHAQSVGADQAFGSRLSHNFVYGETESRKGPGAHLQPQSQDWAQGPASASFSQHEDFNDKHLRSHTPTPSPTPAKNGAVRAEAGERHSPDMSELGGLSQWLSQSMSAWHRWLPTDVRSRSLLTKLSLLDSAAWWPWVSRPLCRYD